MARVDPLVQPLVTPIDSPYDPLVGRMDPLVDAYRVGCGYANGKEMLGYYTMGQTSFLLFIVVVVAILVCLAWRVADEEKTERRTAEEWLKRDALKAFEMRQTLIERFGSPGSSVRPEGSATWIFFGVTAALTFTLLGMCFLLFTSCSWVDDLTRVDDLTFLLGNRNVLVSFFLLF